MDEPRRLCASDMSPRLAQLLEIGREERPGAAAREKARHALLGAAVVVGVASAAKAATAAVGAANLAAGSPGAGSTVAAGGAALGGAAVAGPMTLGAAATMAGKWVAMAAVGVGLATQLPLQTGDDVAPPSVEASQRAASSDRAAVAEEPKGDTQLRPHSELPSEPATAQPTTAASFEPVAPAESGNPPRSTASGTHSHPDSRTTKGDALAAELELVDRARGLFQSGSPAGALGLLADYERSFPRRQLAIEVLVLRMESQLALGRTDRAAALATRVLAMPSRGPHDARAREILRITQGN